MRRTTTGEVPTFDEVYSQEFAYVWSCLRTLGVGREELEDAAQDVFMVVARRLDEFRGEARLRTWLFSITVRVAGRRRRDRFRTHRRRQALGTAVVSPSELDDPQAHVERRWATAVLERFMSELDPDKQRVFELWIVEGLSPQDIADALELSRNTVYSRLRVVRSRFAAVCRRVHARDEARLSPHGRRRREQAQQRVGAAVGLLYMPGPSGLGSSPSWSVAMKASVGLVGSSLVGVLAVGVFAELRPDDTAHRSYHPSAASAGAGSGQRSEPAGSDAAPLPEATVLGSASASPPPSESSAKRGVSAHRVERRGPAVASAPVSPASQDASPGAGSLAQAVAYIEQARGALARGDLLEAQRALSLHGEEFVDGPLTLEREGYLAMVACRRGEPSLAQRFAAVHPDTRMARLVTEACSKDRILDNASP